MSELTDKRGAFVQDQWKQRLGKNCLIVHDYKEISKLIADTILSHSSDTVTSTPEPATAESGSESSGTDEML